MLTSGKFIQPGTLAEVAKAQEEDGQGIILFIDELHVVLGAGKSEGAMDAANLLKPMLARGQLRCIGATTLKEYQKYIEKDAAFERRFQQVGGVFMVICERVLVTYCGLFLHYVSP